ncbi:MAG: prephenate dehydrogenase [Vallitaleaceae bacterium]|nr:prephenate dehydrogenase [Vallitaleaceae bacterium]
MQRLQESDFNMETIGFIGLGLIGGSLAKAIKKNHLAQTIVAYDLDTASLQTAKVEGIVDICAQDIDLLFKHCEIIFLCCPVQVNMDAYRSLTEVVEPTCIITDVASTKQEIIDFVSKCGAPLPFIGGHPMTGSENFGYAASRAHLFENAYYVLTPSFGTSSHQIELLCDFIKGIKALPIVIPPEDHDHVTATISHVPHVIAASLVHLVKALDSTDGHMHTLAAGGFKDITRIASSSPVMWQQICLTNQQNIVEILQMFQKDLKETIHHIENGDGQALYDFFEAAREYRDTFQEKKPGALMQTYAITVDVVDEPGIIAQIATLLSNYNISIKNIGILNNREHTNGVLEIVFYDEESTFQSMKVLTDMQYIVYKR